MCVCGGGGGGGSKCEIWTEFWEKKCQEVSDKSYNYFFFSLAGAGFHIPAQDLNELVNQYFYDIYQITGAHYRQLSMPQFSDFSSSCDILAVLNGASEDTREDTLRRGAT